MVYVIIVKFLLCSAMPVHYLLWLFHLLILLFVFHILVLYHLLLK